MVKKGDGDLRKDNAFGITGVVLGIISLVNLSVVIGIIGLLFSMKQKKVNRNKWSKAGMILNILGIVLGIIAVYILLNYGNSLLSQLPGAY